MPETPMENLIRGDGRPADGCVRPIIFGVLVVLIFLVSIGMLAQYCSPASNANVTETK